MSIQVSPPQIGLFPYVKSYWSLETNLLPGREHIQRIVPNGLPELVFYLEGLPESLDNQHPLGDQVLVSGQQNSFYDLRVSGKVVLFSIIFQPHGLKAFFNVPISEFLNQSVPLRFVLNEVVNEMESKLAMAKTFQQRILIAEAFLWSRLGKMQRSYAFDRIWHSIGIINRKKGMVDICTLADSACLSRKQYERTFRTCVGSSPKQFLRTVRFQRTLKEKSVEKRMSLTELSYLCGYYDQAHMTHDFVKLSGMTPGHYFNDCEVYSDYFQ